MKHHILLLIFLSLCSMASAQTNYDEEHEEESFSLNTTLNSNISYHYTASDRIDLNPGFSYAPARGKSALFEIDPMMVVPPSAGITGGPNPTVDNGVVGAIGGTVNVSALGGAVYSIPIEVLPGKDGMQPSLSVTYNSQAGNGLLGYGWSLSGLSSITRCGRTIYHDLTQTSDAVDYTDDRFMLDGQRLLSISDNIAYGQSGCEYRTEIDNIAKVVSYDGDGQNPDKFKVWTKDGFIIEYGYTTSSKLIYRNDTVAMWMINKISDYNGNYMTYHYHTTTNSCRINYIEYTGCGNVQPMYKVQFNYIDRDDKEYYYLYNQKIVSDVLLDNISIKYQNNEVYKYTFAYDGKSPENGRFYSRLLSVGLEQNGINLNPTLIEWGDWEQYCSQTLTTENSYFKQVCFTGDFNGDGIDDIVTFPYISSDNNYWTCLYGNGNGYFYPSKNSSNYSTIINGKAIKSVRPYDLNGDGLCDLLVETREKESYNIINNTTYYRVYLYAYIANSNGIGFSTEPVLICNYVTTKNRYDNTQVGDYLGDGTNDILVLLEGEYMNGSYGIYAILISYDIDNQSFYYVFSDYVRGSCDNVIPGDFNGDGRLDIILTDGYVSTTYSIDNDGITPLFSGGFPTAWHSCFPGDFNGDGKTDLLSWVIDNNTPKWHVSISSANGFFDQWEVDANQQFPTDKPPTEGASLASLMDNYSYYSINICDMDGDGKSDVVFVFNNAIKIYHSPILCSALSKTPCSFIRDTMIENTPSYYYYNGLMHGQNNISYNLVGKYQSDAYCSVMLRNSIVRPGEYILKSFDNQHKQNYVKSITDGLSNSVSFNYDYFTNHDFYTISNGDRFISVEDRVRKQMIPLKALRSITTENVSGTSDTTQYNYEDLYYHMTGRGVIGFKKSTVINNIDNIKTVNTNKYAGHTDRNATLPFLVPESSTTYLINGKRETPIKEIFTNCVLMAGRTTGNYQEPPVVLQSDLVKINNYSANGTLINTEITEYDYDNYPNTEQYKYNNITGIKKGYSSSSSIMYAATCPFREDIDITYFEPPQDIWLLSRVNKRTTSNLIRDANGWADIIKHSVVHTYNSNHPHLLMLEQINPMDSSTSKLALKTQYTYDFDGSNINKVTTETWAPNDATIQYRTSQIEYSSQYQYRFATKTTNSLEHSASTAYDPMFGWKLSDTDCNGLTVTYTSDFFGIDSETVSPDGIKTHTSKRWSRDHAHAPDSASYYTWTQSSGSYPSMTFYHKTGVPLRYVNHNIDGKVVYVDMKYDKKGRLLWKSLPYEAGNSPEGYIIYSYDQLNRVIITEYPDGTRDEVTYNGNIISSTHYDASNSTSQTITKKYHPNGWLEQTTDSGGNTIKYEYNSDGSLKSSYVEGSNSSVTLTYNSAGMRTSISDPDYGCMQYNYNAFGENISQTTPKGIITTYEYDVLGRMTQRKTIATGVPDEITIWQYSNQSGHLGILDKITLNSGLQMVTYQYDDMQRLVNSVNTYDNDAYSTSYTYDKFGRVKTETYPSGISVRNIYNEGGYLTAIKDLQGNTLWQADDYNILGNLNEFHTGNGLTTYRDYDSENGRLLGIITSDGRNIFQNYAYTYDDFGNFASRKKFGSPMLQENFTYDNFNRLSSIDVNGALNEIVYDRFGRMLSKEQDDFAFYNARFSDEHPHAVSRVETNRQPPFGNHTLTYTPFDKVKTITADTNSIIFDYGYDRQRIRMTETFNGKQRVKTYIGKCEFVSSDNTDDYWLTYLHVGSGIFAVAESTDNGYMLHYVHTDHLGSWDIITDKNGKLEQSLSFDAWGNRRNADTWTGPALDEPLFDRGFTGHEHLYNFGLINMNGRVYDPFLSTFLSPDNYIQCPDNSQNFNRYAYCLNNPLKYTDPSGEWIQYVVGALIGGINGYCIGYSAGLTGSDLFWSTISGAAIGTVTCGVGNYFTSTVGVGFGSICGGAVSGFGYGLLGGVANNSRSLLNDAILGCLKGMASGFMGAMVSASLQFGDSWGAGAFLGGAASNVTSQLLSHDWSGKDDFSLNWKSTLFSAGLSWGIFYGSSYINYRNNVKNWNPQKLKIKFGQYLKIQGMHTRARFWRSEQKGGAFWLTSKGTTNENVIYDEHENTVAFKFPPPAGVNVKATVHDHPYNDSDVAQTDLWNSEADIQNVLKYKVPSIVINKYGAAIAYPTFNGGYEQITNTSFWGNSLWGYGNPYYSYPYYAARYYFNLKP